MNWSMSLLPALPTLAWKHRPAPGAAGHDANRDSALLSVYRPADRAHRPAGRAAAKPIPANRHCLRQLFRLRQENLRPARSAGRGGHQPERAEHAGRATAASTANLPHACTTISTIIIDSFAMSNNTSDRTTHPGRPADRTRLVRHRRPRSRQHAYRRQQWQIVRRMIHATADFEFNGLTEFHPDAVAAGLQAIRRARLSLPMWK